MTLRQLWNISPESFVFVKYASGTVCEYHGGKEFGKEKVATVKGTSYPMYKSVLEVTLEGVSYEINPYYFQDRKPSTFTAEIDINE